MKKGHLIAAVALALIVCAAAALVAFRSGTAPSYPTTRAGWAERWTDMAARFGRTPGENWDLWLDARSEIEAAMAEPGGPDPDRIGAALDPLGGVRITPPIPYAIGTEQAFEDCFDIVTAARNTLRDTIWPRYTDAVARNDLEEARAWWDRGMAVTRVGEAPGLVTGQLVQDACLALMIESLNDYLITPGPVDTAWAAERIASIDITDDLTWFIETEREYGLGVIAGWRASVGFNPLLAGDEAGLFERVMDLWRDSHRGDNPAAAAELDALHARLDSDSIFARRRPAMAVVMPHPHGPMRVRRATLMRLDGLKLLLALRQHQERTGVYPASLDDLVPVELTALPTDPLAPDGRYRYRLLDAGSDDPRMAFVLYSVGSDGVDDGGNWPRQMTANPLMPGRVTGDHVFNRPRKDETPDEDPDAEEDVEQP